MKKPSPDNTPQNVDVLKDYGLEVGRILRVDLSANGTLDSLVLGVRAIEQAAAN